MDGTWVKIKTEEVEAFTEHLNAVESNIKFTREDAKENHLALLDCAVVIGEVRNFQVEEYPSTIPPL